MRLLNLGSGLTCKCFQESDRWSTVILIMELREKGSQQRISVSTFPHNKGQNMDHCYPSVTIGDVSLILFLDYCLQRYIS